MVLSEALDAKAIDVLIDLAFWKLFPDQCKMWRDTKKDICDIFKKEIADRSETAGQDLRRAEHSLMRALRESVVDDVINLYP